MKTLISILLLFVSCSAFSQYKTLVVRNRIGINTNAPKAELHVKGNSIIESNLTVLHEGYFLDSLAIGTNHIASPLTIGNPISPAASWWDTASGFQWTWTMNTFMANDGFFSLGYGDLSTGTNYLWLNPTNGNLHLAAGIDAEKITGNIEESTNALGFFPFFDRDATLNVGGSSATEGTINVYDSNTNLVATISGIYGNITTSGTNSASWFAGNGAGISNVIAANVYASNVISGGKITDTALSTNVMVQTGSVITNQTTNVVMLYSGTPIRLWYSDYSKGNVGFGGGAMGSYNQGNAQTNPTATKMTALGKSALNRFTSAATSDTAVGHSALGVLLGGQFNTAVGESAGANIKDANYNTLIGNNSGSALTNGYANTFVGYNCGQNVVGGSFGYGNVVMGDSAFQNCFDGLNNSVFGSLSMQSATNNICRNNATFGAFSLQNNQMPNQAVFGYKGFWLTVDGPGNSGLGFEVMVNNISGSNNVAVGRTCGTGVISGNTNEYSLFDNYCTFVGADSGRSGTITNVYSLTNSVAIGYGSKINTNNQVRLGNDATTEVVTSGRINATNGIFLQPFITNQSFTVPGSRGVYCVNGTNQLITLPNASLNPWVIMRFVSTNGNGNFTLTNATGAQTIRNGIDLSLKNIGVGEVGIFSDGANWQLASKVRTVWPNAQFSCTTNIALSTTARAISFNTTDFNNSQGIALLVGTNSSWGHTSIWITNSGQYEFSPSLIEKFGGNQTITFWFKSNGTNIPNSATYVTGQNLDVHIATVPFITSVIEPTVFEIWAISTGSGESLSFQAAAGSTPNDYPLSPSIILPVKRISDSRP